tara:strand:+ start:47662 stop:47949 length:288 start_codon:yes stop_codon:yes gene_type:complete
MPDTILNFLALDRYYGLDWAAAIFMFLSMHRLGIHKKDGFIFAALASLCWIAFNLIAESPAGVIANLLIAVMAFRSLATWSKTHPSNPAPNEPRP